MCCTTPLGSQNSSREAQCSITKRTDGDSGFGAPRYCSSQSLVLCQAELPCSKEAEGPVFLIRQELP